MAGPVISNTPPIAPSATPQRSLDAARTSANHFSGNTAEARDKPVAKRARPADAAAPPLSPARKFESQPPPGLLLSATRFVRRTSHLIMDAALIILFAPVIAGWLWVERRNRRPPGV